MNLWKHKKWKSLNFRAKRHLFPRIWLHTTTPYTSRTAIHFFAKNPSCSLFLDFLNEIVIIVTICTVNLFLLETSQRICFRILSCCTWSAIRWMLSCRVGNNCLYLSFTTVNRVYVNTEYSVRILYELQQRLGYCDFLLCAYSKKFRTAKRSEVSTCFTGIYERSVKPRSTCSRPNRAQVGKSIG